MKFVGVVAASSLFGLSAGQDLWAPVQAAVDRAFIPGGVHVLVGCNATEKVFEAQKGIVNYETTLALASSTKWTSGVVMMNVVEDGVVNLDDLASDYLDYWTTDPADMRSGITLRHLLGFTSGFTGGGSSCAGLDFNACVQRTYETARHEHLPGTFYHYNEVHINLAGGVVTAATGQSMPDLYNQYLLQPLGMTGTTLTNPSNPALGAGLTSSAMDYEKFLRALFLKDPSLLAPALIDEMEKDQYPEATRTAFDGAWHYGLANWFECEPPEIYSEWDPACLELDVHSSAGAAGFRPIIDRRLNYYLQIASTAGSTFSMNLYREIKPIVDSIIESGASSC